MYPVARVTGFSPATPRRRDHPASYRERTIRAKIYGMNLSHDDLQQIEAIFDRKLNPIVGELTALREDVKEIYSMIAELQSGLITDKKFSKKSLEDKLLTLNTELLAAAKQAGITLPRN